MRLRCFGYWAEAFLAIPRLVCQTRSLPSCRVLRMWAWPAVPIGWSQWSMNFWMRPSRLHRKDTNSEDPLDRWHLRAVPQSLWRASQEIAGWAGGGGDPWPPEKHAD